jgi:hypothetical protein
MFFSIGNQWHPLVHPSIQRINTPNKSQKNTIKHPEICKDMFLDSFGFSIGFSQLRFQQEGPQIPQQDSPLSHPKN